MLSAGEVEFIPCHHCHAVGPMGGITSANMAVMVVRNLADDTVAYCTMNEASARSCASAPTARRSSTACTGWPMSSARCSPRPSTLSDGGINLNVLMARAITQGDEFHQRNMAATLNFLKEVAPLIVKTDASEDAKQRVIQFLADTDQFFLERHDGHRQGDRGLRPQGRRGLRGLHDDPQRLRVRRPRLRPR